MCFLQQVGHLPLLPSCRFGACDLRFPPDKTKLYDAVMCFSDVKLGWWERLELSLK